MMVSIHGDYVHNGGETRPKEVRALRRKILDLKTILANAITPEEVHEIARIIIDQALGGDREAATWIFDRVIGKPTKAIEVTQVDERNPGEPPKVVLLDWRRNGASDAAESN